MMVKRQAIVCWYSLEYTFREISLKCCQDLECEQEGTWSALHLLSHCDLTGLIFDRFDARGGSSYGSFFFCFCGISCFVWLQNMEILWVGKEEGCVISMRRLYHGGVGFVPSLCVAAISHHVRRFLTPIWLLKSGIDSSITAISEVFRWKQQLWLRLLTDQSKHT